MSVPASHGGGVFLFLFKNWPWGSQFISTEVPHNRLTRIFPVIYHKTNMDVEDQIEYRAKHTFRFEGYMSENLYGVMSNPYRQSVCNYEEYLIFPWKTFSNLSQISTNGWNPSQVTGLTDTSRKHLWSFIYWHRFWSVLKAFTLMGIPKE